MLLKTWLGHPGCDHLAAIACLLHVGKKKMLVRMRVSALASCGTSACLRGDMAADLFLQSDPLPGQPKNTITKPILAHHYQTHQETASPGQARNTITRPIQEHHYQATNTHTGPTQEHLYKANPGTPLPGKPRNSITRPVQERHY